MGPRGFTTTTLSFDFRVGGEGFEDEVARSSETAGVHEFTVGGVTHFFGPSGTDLR